LDCVVHHHVDHKRNIGPDWDHCKLNIRLIEYL